MLIISAAILLANWLSGGLTLRAGNAQGAGS
jgi:hypothetical protein